MLRLRFFNVGDGDSILIEERLIDSDEASLETEIFGKTYKTPIMMPAFSHVSMRSLGACV